MRTILDANVIIRILLATSNPRRAVDLIVEAAFRGAFTVLVPAELRREVLWNVSIKPTLSRRIPFADADRLVGLLERSGQSLPLIVGPHRPLCRDPKDDYLIAHAESGRAEFLVTGDIDLLVLDGEFPFRILSPPDFLAVLRRQGLT